MLVTDKTCARALAATREREEVYVEEHMQDVRSAQRLELEKYETSAGRGISLSAGASNVLRGERKKTRLVRALTPREMSGVDPRKAARRDAAVAQAEKLAVSAREAALGVQREASGVRDVLLGGATRRARRGPFFRTRVLLSPTHARRRETRLSFFQEKAREYVLSPGD